MKKLTNTRDENPVRPWPALLGWAVALPGAVLFLYISGAVTARVLYLKGMIPDGSRSLAVAETLFAPVNYPYNASPIFKAAFDRSVAMFVPKEGAER